jgi:hypothetical protein
LLGAARRSHEPSCRITLRIYAFFMQASIGSNSADSSSSPVNGRRRALRGCARASARATGGFSRRPKMSYPRWGTGPDPRAPGSRPTPSH